MANFLSRWFGGIGASQTSGTASPEGWLLDLFAGMITNTGLRISLNEAMSVPGVAACVNIISEDLAKVPLKVYRRKAAGGKDLAKDHPLYHLLHNAPTPWMTSFNWRRATFGSAMSRGDALTRIRRNGRGDVFRLVPIRPDRFTIKYGEEGEPFFEVNGNTSRYVLTSEDAVHLAYRPDFLAGESGGIRGVSPIQRHTEAIALAIATERFAAAFFRNGARPSIAVEMPGKFPSQDHANRVRQRLEQAYSGLSNSFKVAVLEFGMKIKELTYKNSDSQLIEVRKEQAVEMCRIFGVPPHKIGILDKATFSNIEHQAIEYVTGPVSAMATSHEQAIWLSALTPAEQEELSISYDLNGLLRGDIASRYKAYATGRQWGWLNADTIREWEDMDPLPNDAGKSYFVPVNMKEVGGEAEDPAMDPQPEEPDEDPTPSNLVLGPDGFPARRLR